MTERSTLSVVTVIDVTEGGTEVEVGEDYTFDVPTQRLTRAAGALAMGTDAIVRFLADRIVEDSVASGRPVHRTESAEFDSRAAGALRASALIDLFAQPALIVRAELRANADVHLDEGQLVTLPEAQLRLMGIPGVVGDEQ